MKRDRKEISRLKRENLQLRKLLAQQDRDAANAKEIIEEEKERDREEEKRPIKVKCPKCKGDMELMDLGGRGIYKVCSNRSTCWHRERHKQ